MGYGTVVAVDWSAATRPSQGKDSIWIAEARAGGMALGETVNPPTRDAAMAEIARRSAAAIASGQSVLVGVDFPIGYPAGTATALGCSGWQDLWRLLAKAIMDRPDNANNRFVVAGDLNRRLGAAPGPFWGRPESRDVPHLPTKRPTWQADWPFAERRLTDDPDRIKNNGLSGRPQPVWKLYTTGSVGGQALTGIARMAHLRFGEPGFPVLVWPFDTGFAPGPTEPHLLIVEMYPSLWAAQSHGLEPKDRDQVRVAATHLAEAAGSERLQHYLSAPLRAEPAARRQVEAEEAWMIGLV